ncbi:MAG: hypothetical protein QJR13_07445, partial [Bacillota bacterium]|nr:hypothetical protein [Bacillota bacterium]
MSERRAPAGVVARLLYGWWEERAASEAAGAGWAPGAGGGAAPLSERWVLRRLVLFHFLVTLRAVDDRQYLVPVAVDALTEEAYPLEAERGAAQAAGRQGLPPAGEERPVERRLLAGGGSLPEGLALRPPGEPGSVEVRPRAQGEKLAGGQGRRWAEKGWEGEGEHQRRLHRLGRRHYALARLYRAGYQAALEVVKAKIEPRLAELERARRQEEGRLVEYYRGLGQELLAEVQRAAHRAAVAQVRRQLSHSRPGSPRRAELEQEERERLAELEEVSRRSRRELAALEREQRQRLAELERRYTVELLLSLVGAAEVYLPFRVRTLLLRAGEVEREVEAASCLLAGIRIWPRCEVCGEAPSDLSALRLAPDGLLLCSRCAVSCPACGGWEVRGKTAPCHLCGQEVCRRCVSFCPEPRLRLAP